MKEIKSCDERQDLCIEIEFLMYVLSYMIRFRLK